MPLLVLPVVLPLVILHACVKLAIAFYQHRKERARLARAEAESATVEPVA